MVVLSTGADAGVRGEETAEHRRHSDPATPVARRSVELAQQRFERFAQEQPRALAASLRGSGLTYGELSSRSHRLAHHLSQLGVGPGIAVGVCLKPSVEVLVTILAIWEARGIYLPLDPTHPEALVRQMLDEARPRLVLTSSQLAPLTRSHAQLFLDADAASYLSSPPTSPPGALQVESSLEDVACLFYTSGTTGRPKGVALTQGNVAHYLGVARERYGFGADDVFLSVARYTFSISLFELLSPVCCGGRLKLLERDQVLAPERFVEALGDVTVLHAGPSLLGSLFRHLRAAPAAPRSFPGMRHASSGGDVVLPTVMEDMKRVFPDAELFVIYGCTEIACMGTTFEIPRTAKVTRTLVGKPFPDVTLRLMNREGDVGEIALAGRGVAEGYLERPDLTREKFVEHDGERFYQTGDLGRLHPDGTLEILGRRDFQVQIHGIRLELAGIEAMTIELGLAAHCAVVAKEMGEGDVRLIAFVVKPCVDTLTAFRQALAARLPDYSLPHHVVVLESMPLTVNGKLDRNALKAAPWDHQLGATDRTQPGTERQRTILDVFVRTLGRSDFGIDDDFFDLGGDSLRAIVALEEIERALGVNVAPQLFFEKGTVRALADLSPADREPGEGEPGSHLVLLGGIASGAPIFAISGIHTYRALAKHVSGGYAVYGVYVEREVAPFDARSRPYTVEDLAREYREAIERRDPKGPYRILGYSFAGMVAYEVAQQLIDAGKEVHFLGLIDAVLPEWTSPWRFRLDQIARMRSVSPRDLLAFVGRRVVERLRASRPMFVRYRDDPTLGSFEEQRDALNRKAAESYMRRIRPYDGAVTLVTSSLRLRQDPLKNPTCGWDPLVSSLTLHGIDADHFRMMSDDPYVAQLAQVLERDLRAGAKTWRRQF